jgi:hypothetical protein
MCKGRALPMFRRRPDTAGAPASGLQGPAESSRVSAGSQDPTILVWKRGRKAAAGSWPSMGPQKEDRGDAGIVNPRVVNPQTLTIPEEFCCKAAGCESQNGQ